MTKSAGLPGPRGLSRRWPYWLIACSLFVTAGCATDSLAWLMRQGIGQVEVMAGARPVSRVLDDPNTPETIRSRLRLVEAARRFARDELGLAVGQQYRSVTFLDNDAVVYVVSAAPQTSLVPFRWEYPILGRLPYRGFFVLEEAERQAQQMIQAGYDVSVRPVPTYSLLGVLPDPIVSPMLFSGDEAWLVETVIHELAHATVFASSQGAFNESLATFIGREGRRRFVEHHYGRDSAIYQYMLRKDADRESYGRAVGALAFDLRVLFTQAKGLPRAEILERKDQIFLRHQKHYQNDVAETLNSYRLRTARLPDNNAELSSYGLYTMNQHLYRRAYRSCNEDMRCLIRMLRSVSRAKNPQLALEERVTKTTTRERWIQ